MRIWHEPKLVLFHTPKTAGTSVFTMLDKNYEFSKPVLGDPHVLFVKGKQYIPEGYTCFTIFRNPYERAISYYFWFKKTSNSQRFPFKKFAARMEFNEWVRDRYRIDTLKQEDYYGPNVHVIKHENLKMDLHAFLNEKLNLGIDLELMPVIYKTKHRKAAEYMNKQSEEIIYQREKWIFDNGFYERLL
jgi:hypothetical protein